VSWSIVILVPKKRLAGLVWWETNGDGRRRRRYSATASSKEEKVTRARVSVQQTFSPTKGGGERRERINEGA